VVTMMARAGSPLSGFSPIAHDVISSFEIENWETGTAKSPDGSGLYAIHLCRPADVPENPLQPAHKAPKRSETKRDRAEAIIKQLWGTIPSRIDVPNPELERRVGDAYEKQWKGTIDRLTIRRAAHR
jgi:hypothetical protein